jgi:hypothetical protein
MPEVKDPGILAQLNGATQVQPQPGGGMIVTDTTVARREARADTSEARTSAQNTFRTMTAEEAAAQGLPAGGVYQINGLGEIKTIQAAPSAEAKEKATAREGRGAKLSNLLSQLDRAEEIYRQEIKGGLPNPISGRLWPFSEGNSRFGAAAASAAQQAFSAFRVPGEGPQSDADLRLFVEANRPLPTDTEAAIEEKFQAVRARARAELKALGVAPVQQTPLSGPSPERTEVSGSGPMFTAQDRDLQARLQQAYSQGANLQQLQAIAAEYNRQFPIGSQQELDAARAQGRQISVEPSGQRTGAQEFVADPRSEMGILGAIGETITGSERSTPEIEALPDWTGMPAPGLSGFMASLGTMVTGPEETARILLAQGVATASRQDEKGNFILTGTDGREYAIKPGFRASDIPRAIGAVAAFTPAGRATTAGGAALSGGLTQAAIEGTQAATGGQFDSEEVLLASGGNVLGQQAGRAFNAVRDFRRGRAAAPVEPTVAQPAAPTAAPVQQAASQADAIPTLTPEMQAEVGNLARQAIGSGKPAREAQEKLAIMAKIDPEAKAAAERLGMDLTPDILSDDTRLLTVTGLARSQVNSEAETAWINTARQTIEKADDAMAQVGASRNLAGVSQEVRTTLQSSMDELERGATALRDEVNAAINVRDRVDAGNLQSALAKTINDLGGIAEAKAAMSAEEKKLLAMLGEGEVARQPTYAMLERVRDQIGEAIFKNKGPWVDTDTATLKRYYGALAQDRLDYVAAKGEQELADKMRVSNDLYSKMYDVRRTMQTLFGKQLESDISGLITQAVTSGAKGQGKALRTIMNNVPEELQAQTLLTGLMSAAGRSGPNGGFSFTKYAQVYRGLRENAPIYSEIAKTIGPDAARVLQDLYAISKRMARAENAVIKTGKANQPLINALNAESLVSNVAKGAMRRGAITGGTAMAGGVAGGPVGAVVGGAIADALQKTATQAGKTSLDRLHSVLSSEPFKDLVEKVAIGDVPQSAVNKVANDGAFRKFAKILGLNTFEQRKNWLQSSMVAGAASQSRPEAQPTSVIEVR